MLKNKKSIPLDQFINKALYDKSNGYYFKKNPFGKNGDYITSPNISRLFSEMLSIWTIAFWENLKFPKKMFFLKCQQKKLAFQNSWNEKTFVWLEAQNEYGKNEEKQKKM